MKYYTGVIDNEINSKKPLILQYMLDDIQNC